MTDITRRGLFTGGAGAALAAVVAPAGAPLAADYGARFFANDTRPSTDRARLYLEWKLRGWLSVNDVRRLEDGGRLT